MDPAASFPYDCDAGFSPESCVSDSKNGDHFAIDDLLDFPADDNAVAMDAGLEAAVNGNSVHSSPGATATDSSCNSPFSVTISSPEPYFNPTAADLRCPAAGHFSGEICDPYDDLAELEWLSNVMDESFSSEDTQKQHLLQGIKTRPDDAVSPTNLYHFHPHSPATGSPLQPGKPACAKAARSKRSRVTTGNWPSRLLEMTPTPPGVAVNSESESDKAKKAVKPAAAHKKKDSGDGATDGEVRKCLHCATDKTPQWRTGPLGPKTLCNACGVRFKSGRLVPEYRPAASPTFVLTKHSNSHRKVLELRRQKEMEEAQPQAAAPPYLHLHHHQNVMYDVAGGDEYLIHQHIGQILER